MYAQNPARSTPAHAGSPGNGRIPVQPVFFFWFVLLQEYLCKTKLQTVKTSACTAGSAPHGRERHSTQAEADAWEAAHTYRLNADDASPPVRPVALPSSKKSRPSRNGFPV